MSKKDNLLLKDTPLQETDARLQSKNEIDLIVLIAKIFKIFRNYIASFLILLISCLILSTTGYLWFKPVYTSNLVASSKELNFLVLTVLINNLEELIKEENYKQLSQKLEITEDEAEDLWSINPIDLLEGQKELERERIYRDPEIKYQYFVIKASVQDKKLFSKLQKGLTNYLENHEYVQKRTELNRKNKELLIGTIEKEKLSMDSLKRNLESGIFRNNKQELSIIDPAGLYEKYVYMTELQLKLRRELNLYQDIQVIEGFTQYEKPTSFNFAKSVAAGILAAIFSWIVYIIFFEIIRLVRKVEI